jgi:hypothetical protein
LHPWRDVAEHFARGVIHIGHSEEQDHLGQAEAGVKSDGRVFHEAKRSSTPTGR